MSGGGGGTAGAGAGAGCSVRAAVAQRERGGAGGTRGALWAARLEAARSLYRRELLCHYGCVNAIEFSHCGERFISGGDDRRVMVWDFSKTILERGAPEPMKGHHESNIFCLGITSDCRMVYSGGNDDQVIVHDVETKDMLELLIHQRAVCGLGINPHNEKIVATAGNDGRLLLFDTRHSDYESLVISRSRKAYHAVMFHPVQTEVLVSANARDGVALWDLRTHKVPLIRYLGSNGSSQSSMSVRFNNTGNQILALRRRQLPVMYATDRPQPIALFHHQDYYNSCTMKSCSFAGDHDEYVLSGSDDFNLYMWKVPECGIEDDVECPMINPHMVLYGHRSIVNQVRYNPHFCLIASSGVEKVIKIWSPIQYPGMRGSLMEESQGADNPREVYSHEDYVSLVHDGAQYITHNYSEQSTSEDPRMMAFFDSLVQREVEGWREETDSQESDSESDVTFRNDSKGSDSSDSDQLLVDFLPLPPKRISFKRSMRKYLTSQYYAVHFAVGVNGRNQRCTRASRMQPTRQSNTVTLQKRESLRRNKQKRGLTTKSSKGNGGVSMKGKRAATRSTRTTRSTRRQVTATPDSRAAHRGAVRRDLTAIPSCSRISAPSSERTDSDEPSQSLYRHTGKIIRPLRRRMNLSRAVKRKPKTLTHRNADSRRNSYGLDNASAVLEEEEPNLALPSTSTGYRGHTSPLFRIAEVDSDDDHSASSRPISPRQTNAPPSPPNLVSIVPTPINGSRDSLGDFLRSNVPESTSNQSSPAPEGRRYSTLRRSLRRNGRNNVHRSDSSESETPKERPRNDLNSERLAYSPIVKRLLDETNESEIESSSSTAHEVASPMRNVKAKVAATPDSGVFTGPCSSGGSRHPVPADEGSDDTDYALIKFRQRVKKARRNYRNNLGDSDSN